MSGFIASYVQGLKIISQSATLRNALADPADSGEISADFLTWLEARPAIAQLRFISSDGRELIRADRRDDTIMTVDGGSLQDKSSRYYFQNTIDLPPNALYLSPIDLNIERNRIEVPWRPMVRLATPIYQSASEPIGILIMNLDATDILKAIEGTARALGQPVQVVNSEGYWLSGINPKDRFGFMFDNDMTLSSTKPGLWEAMLATQAGTVDDNHEQIVYSTMSLPALLKSRTTYDSVIAGDPELHLLIRFPEPPGFFSVRNLPGFAGLFCLCTLFSIFTAAILASRRAAEEKARAAEEQVVRLDRLAGLGALVAGVAHEMNTPIGNALMTATTVDHRAQGLAKAAHEGRIGRNSLTTTVNDIRDGVAMMSQSLQRASEIIRNFKQFAVDQTSDRRRKFALDSYILETLHLMEPQFSNAGHRVKAGHLERVTMDSFPGPLGQVLTNLLTNARVHAFRNKPHGTATVTAQTSSADQIAITVSDDGNGISPEQLEQVFIPSFRRRLVKTAPGWD